MLYHDKGASPLGAGCWSSAAPRSRETTARSHLLFVFKEVSLFRVQGCVSRVGRERSASKHLLFFSLLLSSLGLIDTNVYEV